MTFPSMTTENKTYETTVTSCTCPDFQYRQAKIGGHCKHIQALRHEMNHATHFMLLRMKYDCRLNGDLETRRCYYELSLGY